MVCSTVHGGSASREVRQEGEGACGVEGQGDVGAGGGVYVASIVRSVDDWVLLSRLHLRSDNEGLFVSTDVFVLCVWVALSCAIHH